MRRPAPTCALALLVGITVLGLGACSSGSDDNALAAATTAPAAPDASVEDDLEAFCAGFTELAAGREPGDPSQLDLGDGSPEDVAAAYAAQRATVVEIAAAAPQEIRGHAMTYIEVIDRRATAAAGTAGEGMTAEERRELAQGMADQQAQVNELLAYARDTCPDFE